MRNTLLILFATFSLILTKNCLAQTVFDSQKAIKVSNGDTVAINKNAVIIDSLDFEKIRLNLLHYTELKDVYEQNLDSNRKLVSQLRSTQVKLKKLLESNKIQSQELIALNKIVENLNALSNDMGTVNDNLASNNQDFSATINNLESTNKELRKELKKLRFRNVRNYIISGLIGAAIGGAIVAIY
ncbi:hypothetical protein [Fulvivirga lutea]|uniref:Uncharacterized protein n=1 Tax=Fulvivirga lutea TaxID=2810512 RepID=A0A974WEY4_9BACT|nr:hypothetical protein [Fulvivirga lutea]QSE96690.1 hypothetical protein JR347_13950 [Fulvivirga lutea]